MRYCAVGLPAHLIKGSNALVTLDLCRRSLAVWVDFFLLFISILTLVTSWFCRRFPDFGFLAFLAFFEFAIIFIYST